jgi:hypothetical protein
VEIRGSHRVVQDVETAPPGILPAVSSRVGLVRSVFAARVDPGQQAPERQELGRRPRSRHRPRESRRQHSPEPYPNRIVTPPGLYFGRPSAEAEAPPPKVAVVRVPNAHSAHCRPFPLAGTILTNDLLRLGRGSEFRSASGVASSCVAAPRSALVPGLIVFSVSCRFRVIPEGLEPVPILGFDHAVSTMLSTSFAGMFARMPARMISGFTSERILPARSSAFVACRLLRVEPLLGNYTFQLARFGRCQPCELLRRNGNGPLLLLLPHPLRPVQIRSNERERLGSLSIQPH